MCGNHRASFNAYSFFIRFVPEVSLIPLCFRPSAQQETIFVNYSNATSLQQFHGKAIALDISNKYVPFQALFIIHEMHVRGVQVFQPVFTDIPRDLHCQDWMLLDRPDDHGDDNHGFPVQLQLLTISTE
jgi:hypothetical protein